MRTIAVIGGGEMKDLETLEIDREIVALTGKETPRALFIPTASHDAEGYCDTFNKVYGELLGCRTEHLLLATRSYTLEELRETIMSADLIYVGGGNTRMMLEIWQNTGVDTLLKAAYESGAVCSGISAGSICWFEYGQSDIEMYESGDSRNYMMLEGLGLLKGVHCPHYNEDTRALNFIRMMLDRDQTGIAVDNHCAVVIRENEYRVISVQDGAKVYRISNTPVGVNTTEILPHNDFRPIKELYIG
ncbi:Type 1 glutamine amidotransferase-like domain-containing protein [Paenibacillus sp. sgz500958]|uniref:Type 1 glutamine amidotransferase-like domain-containing protein n=1 Tax=Paenibacillus sp. sgz500958 TaxID=3242475 RepID=UPI0036D3C210